MTVEDIQNSVEDIIRRWDNGGENPSSTLDQDKAVEMGILEPQQQSEGNITQELPPEGAEIKYTNEPQQEKQFEKLDKWETTKDVATSVGVEALHFFQPKKWETQYESRTRFGDTVKTIYRYGVGFIAFSASLAFGGGAVAGAGVAAKAPKLIKAGVGLKKLLGSVKLIKTTEESAKVAIIGAGIINGAVDGLIASCLSDFILYRPEEGEFNMGDMLPFMEFLHTNPDDSNFELRCKNAAGGLIAAIPIGATFGGAGAALSLYPPVNRLLKNIHKAVNAQTKKEAGEALAKTAQSKVELDNIANGMDLENAVNELRQQAAETGEEVSQLIIDNIPADKVDTARAMAKVLEEGEQIEHYGDGTWSIKVTNWEDAYKVTPEQYREQLAKRDIENGMDYAGDTAISHQDEAVKDTWINRGWIGENEDLNKTNANKIAKNYKDKWQIDNNVKVEFVDGLTINGERVEGNTSSAGYLGKQQKKTGKKLPDITIKIDTNAKNPYATLRSELEHARDIAKGEVPNQAERHFSRYNGLNEGEAAPDYVYKKSVSKAQKAGNIAQAAEKDVTKVNEEIQPTAEEAQAVQAPPENPLKELTPEEIGNRISTGEIDFKDMSNIEKVVKHIATTDIDITGHTWEEVLNDADSFFAQALKDNPTDAAAYFANSDHPEILNEIYRQQLGATKLISVLKDIQAKADPEANLRILTAVRGLNKYIDEVGSGYGRGLNAQKLVKGAMDTFGANQLTDLQLQGIQFLADILKNKTSLNFTRGESLKKFKQDIYSSLKKNEAYDTIMYDSALAGKVNEVIERLYKDLQNGKEVDPYEELMNSVLKEEGQEAGFYAKLADSTKGFTDVVKYWTRQAPSYVINNILGLGSAFKNLSSAVVQTNLYPTYKILGGILTANGALTREGIDQWCSSMVNLSESIRLAKQAFYKGDGMLTNTKELIEGNLVDGFHEWATNLEELQEQGLGVVLQNIHSVIPRFMMATDEFSSQLNYRNIVRAKALRQAREEVKNIGSGDVGSIADEIFKKQGFRADGRPLDFEAYVEAKDMLFQVPLNRKMYNYATGDTEYTGIAPTLISNIGASIQAETQKYTILKLFMPFVKTPANITDQALQANPLFAVFNANVRRQLTSSNPEVRAKLYGKMGVMLAVGAGATVGAINGVITGSPPRDPKEKTALYKTGWKPYSIKIGDKYISYMNMITPLDSYLAFCADSVQFAGKYFTEDNEKQVDQMGADILGMIFNDYIDQAGFRENTEKILDILNPATGTLKREQLAASTLQGFLPWSSNVNSVRSVVKTMKGDTEQRKATGFYENLLNNYSDLFAGTQDYKRDVFGNRIDQYGLLIAKATDVKDIQPEYAEMERLARLGYTPANIGNLLAKTGVPLTEFKSQETGRSAYDAMYDELIETRIGGKSLQEAVGDLISTERYQSLPDGVDTDGMKWSTVPYQTKTKVLNDLFQRYYNIAKNRVINQRGDEFLDKDGQTMRERSQSIRTQMLDKLNRDNLDSNIIHKTMNFI